MHATEFLKAPQKQTLGPVVVLSGSERHLKQQALHALMQIVLGSDDDVGLTRFDGRESDWRTVSDELATVSMWGEKRLVLVEEAGPFVSANRSALEKYVQKPARQSVLALDVGSWKKNTRLAKAVAEHGLEIECAQLKGGAAVRWLTGQARSEHGKTIGRDAAQLVVELAGEDLGLLDQELAKLAAYVGDRERIEAEDVTKLVGGWKAETTWTMIGAVRDDNLGLALECLNKLLVSGESPQKILGGISFVYRKLAHATELSRQGMKLNAALNKAGVFRNEIASAERYLRRIGRPQAERFYDRLLAADAALKGSSRLNPQLQLEKLLVELTGRGAA